MGSGRSRWKFSFHHRSSASSPSPSRTTTTTAASTPCTSASFKSETPSEFLCPVSGSLMADPVILPTGHTFERACIEVCAELAFSPPSVSPPLHMSPTSPTPLLIPNGALKTAIESWCDRASLPRPVPLSSETAREIVLKLIPQDRRARVLEEGNKPDRKLIKRSENSVLMSSNSSLSLSSTSNHSSSSTSSSFETPKEESKPSPELPSNPSTSGMAESYEDEILLKLINGESDPIEQDAATAEAVASLRCASRESRDRRIALCTPRILASLRHTLLSRDPIVLTDAVAVVVNLSVEPENKVLIVRSGAVPPLIDILRYGAVEAREHAAGALFSLAVDQENRAPIGVLGAIPPLIQLFCKSDGSSRARHDAGRALYHLTLMETNRGKVARIPGAVRRVISIATSEDEIKSVRKLAMMLVCNLAGCTEGRAALLDSGAVSAVVGLIKLGFEEEYSIAALYGMSKMGLRFRGLAKEVGVEEILAGIGDSGEEVRKNMVRKVVQIVQGEEKGKGKGLANGGGGDWMEEWNVDALDIDDDDEEEESIVSLGVGMLPKQRREVWGESGSTSNKF